MIKMMLTVIFLITSLFGASQSYEPLNTYYPKDSIHSSFKSKKLSIESNSSYSYSNMHRSLVDCPSDHTGTLWIFGSDGIVLNFESGEPVEEDNVFFGDFINNFHSDEPSVIELDDDGNLLFYSDNDNIFNRNHVIMDNGNPFKGSQSTSQMISIKQPGSVGIYYVFMPESENIFDPSLDSLKNLYYNIVNMNGASGLGSITLRDELLMPFGSEKISAIRHCNGRDWWVVTHQTGNNHFHSYLINENGINTNAIISSIGHLVEFNNTKIGTIKFSHDGSLISMTSVGKRVNGYNFNGVTEVFKFDNSTGVVTESIFKDTSSMRSNYGIEYSPNGKYLYVGDTRDKLVQYDISDLDSAAIKESEVILYTYDQDNPINIGALQLGPDNKIYIANISDSSLHIIHDPDKKGLACNFEPFGLKLQNGESFLGLPNFPANVYRQEYPIITGVDAIDLCQDSTASYYATGRCTLEDYTWELIGNNQITNTTGDSTQIIATVQSRDILVLTRTTACGVYQDSMVVDIRDCEIPCDLTSPEIIVSSDVLMEGESVTLSLLDPQADLTYTWSDDNGIIGYGNEITYIPYQIGNHTIEVETCSEFCHATSYANIQVGDCPSDHTGTLWIFGRDGIVLNFESGEPVEEDNVFFGDFLVDFRSSEPSIIELDDDGNLLFYSDNDNIFNRNHVIMDNGNPFKGSQSASQMISIKQPGSVGIYYVFMPEPLKSFDASLDSMQSLYYSIVDMNSDGGMGSVTIKDEFLMDFATEKISAVRHCNGHDWWIVTHQAGNNNFHSYLIDQNGLNTNPLISMIGDTTSFLFSKSGMIKFSEDGHLITMTSVGLTIDGVKFKGTTEVFKFDNSTGVVTESIFKDTSSMRSNYGIEYSPNGKYLYVGDTRDKLVQYDISVLDSAAIKESEVILYTYDQDNPINIGALQFGPDNKIYIANISDSSLHIIHDPDKKGLACNFEPFGLKLQNGESFLGLPNFPANVYRQEYPIITGVDAIDLCQDSTASYYATGRCTLEDYTWELIGNNQITNTTGDSTQIIATVQSRDILVLTRTTACGVYQDSMVVDIRDCEIPCDLTSPEIIVSSDVLMEGESVTLSLLDPQADLTYTWSDDNGIIGYGNEITYIPYQIGNHTIEVETCSEFCHATSYANIQVGDCPSDHTGTLWIFGRDGIVLNFESGEPAEEDNVFFGDFLVDFRSDEPSIIELDDDGNLLFYSDNDNIFNRNHVIMDNGNPFKGSQSTSQMISIKQPGSVGIYYVFMPESENIFDPSLDSLKNLYYNIVNMNGASGLGSITLRDELLMPFGSEKISAIRHCNGRDWWVVTHQTGNNHFHSYLINENGINTNAIISSIGHLVEFNNTKIGTIKFSHDGSLISMTSVGKRVNGYNFNGVTEVFKFDNSTGVVTESIFKDTSSMRSNYGIEYSPNGKYLYVGDTRDKLVQYDISDLDSAAIKESEVILYTYDQDNPINIGALQLGPDNKIYIANISDSSLHIIHDPDKKGLACNFEPFGLKLQNGESFLGLPNFPGNVYRQEYPIITGVDAIDLCQDSTASYYAKGRCTLEDYTWELIGNNQITNTTGDSTQIIATVQSRDILVLTRTTACGVYQDSMVVDIRDCDFECAIDFTWVTIDSLICEGEDAIIQYNSNASSIAIGDQIYANNNISISDLTIDTCINMRVIYDAFCDTSFVQCFQVRRAIQYDQFDFESIVCKGNTSTLTYNTDADIVELLDESGNLVAIGSNDMIITPSILNDTTFYLRLGRFDENCERIIPLAISIDTEIYQEMDTMYQCWNDTIIINDSIVSLQGSYNWILSTDDNCDSLYKLEVIHYPISPTDSIITFSCDISDTMTTWSTYFNSDGCESLRIQQTRLNASSISYLQDSDCDTTSAGLDTLILPNSLGCDSLVITSTSWIAPSQYDTIIQMCVGDTLFIDDEIFFQEGLFDFKSTTLASSGCDSIVSVSIEYYDNGESNIARTICSGDSIVISGQSFSISGFYDILIGNESINGCDSLISLDLTVLPHTEVDTIFNLCLGDTISFMGIVFNEQNPTGIIRLPFQNLVCDSITYNVLTEYHDLAISVDIYDASCGSTYGSIIVEADENTTLLLLDDIPIEINSDTIQMLIAKEYTLTASGMYGCSGSVNFEILSSDELVVDYPDTLFLSLNEQVEIDILANQELSSVNWETEDFNCITQKCESVSFTALSGDPIVATIVSVTGCTQIITIEVVLERELTFPIANIFSPNSDGVNDNWVLDFSESNLIPVHMVVFDRWANKVFDTSFDSKYDIRSWGGFHRNRKVVNGVYVYYFKYMYENEEQYKCGSITVID